MDGIRATILLLLLPALGTLAARAESIEYELESSSQLVFDGAPAAPLIGMLGGAPCASCTPGTVLFETIDLGTVTFRTRSVTVE